ncbi:MAG: RHS repeat-associated core domain-containing protein [Thermoguttaceae bacterium]
MDQLLADEQLLPSTGTDRRLVGGGAGGEGGYNLTAPGRVVWPLTDNLGTVCDLAEYNAQTGVTSVVNHRVYDAYGNLKSETNPSTGQAAAVDCLFAFTGRLYDKQTGLQNNLNRWYDPKVGRWMSEDPSGFTAGDTNTRCYCFNSPTNFVDPSGLSIPEHLIGHGAEEVYNHIIVEYGDKARPKAAAIGLTETVMEVIQEKASGTFTTKEGVNSFGVANKIPQTPALLEVRWWSGTFQGRKVKNYQIYLRDAARRVIYASGGQYFDD